MPDDAALDLIERWRNGDQQAATELFERYARQLIGLAASRLSTRVAQRVDPEDVVHSAYRSFFAAAQAGRYDLERGGDLWSLLVSITLHKLHHQVRWNSAAKRAVGRERPLDAERGPHGLSAQLLARQPSPIEAVALADEVEQLLQGLDASERQIFELRLQGHNLEEIATAAGRSERTICRVLERIKLQLEQVHTRER
ncbi:MAG: sigma-70 family RNA polymerase sigma factor [Planctomycetia bacterium]|nr:sigma-70 family RNA polymerase sigma factor [Planctomycetia bacterium]